MRILVSNDDGYLAPGLAALVRAAERFGEVTVIAPERNRSGASNSLTLDRPLAVSRADNGFYHVEGTPTDCVHIGLTGLGGEPFDLVVSGLNYGPNMGDDTIYSGTVAAAMEGHLFGIPAIAFSLAEKDLTELDSATRVAAELIERVLARPFASPLLLNVNIPNLPYERIAGFVTTRLGKRHQAEPVFRTESPRGETLYWIGAPGGARDAGPGTDFHALSEGRVSVTPLQIDLTASAQIDEVNGWLM